MQRFNHREESEFKEKLVAVNRVSKTVKGGRNMRFSALIVIGDEKGRVGMGMGKAVEIPEAIRKAVEDAKKHLVTVPIVGTTIPHEVIGKYGTGKVVLEANGMEEDFREMLEGLKDNTVSQTERFDKATVRFLEILLKLTNKQRVAGIRKGNVMSVESEMNTLIEYITMNPKRIVSNQELADVIFHSKDYVIKRFFANFGVTPYDYQIQQKIFSAKNMLANMNLSVKEIANSLGYDDQHYFSYMFKKRCGMSPTQYRKKIRSEYSHKESDDSEQ